MLKCLIVRRCKFGYQPHRGQWCLTIIKKNFMHITSKGKISTTIRTIKKNPKSITYQ